MRKCKEMYYSFQRTAKKKKKKTGANQKERQVGGPRARNVTMHEMLRHRNKTCQNTVVVLWL